MTDTERLATETTALGDPAPTAPIGIVPDVRMAKRPGSRIPAGMVKRGLQQLIELASTGRGTPEDLVEASRDPSAPLHALFKFDVDDKLLAHEHRLHIARQVWASVEIRYEDRRGQPQQTRAFVSVKVTNSVGRNEPIGKEGASRMYVPMPEAARNYREQVIESATREMKSFRLKHAALKELMSKDEIVDMFEATFFG